MRQAIRQCGRELFIAAKDRDPLGKREICRHDCRSALVPIGDQIEEQLAADTVEGHETQLVDDEDVAPEAPRGGPIAAISDGETTTGNRALMLEEPLIFEQGMKGRSGVRVGATRFPAPTGQYRYPLVALCVSPPPAGGQAPQGRVEEYVALVTGPMLHACAQFARWVDVFCEPASAASRRASRWLSRSTCE